MSQPTVVVTGSRSLTDPMTVTRAFLQARVRLDPVFHKPGVRWLHGGATGVDSIVDDYLRRAPAFRSDDITVRRPEYGRYPPQVAPLKRNEAMMVEAAQAEQRVVVAIWDPSSETGGTIDALRHAGTHQLPVVVEVVYPST